MYDRHCSNKPLTKLDKIQTIGDYVIAIGGTFILFILDYLNYIPKEIIKLFYVGFLLGFPFEFVQPRLGWVYYYKCITYKVAPVKTMWIIHSIWDSLILLSILNCAILCYGKEIIYKYNSDAVILMSSLGMFGEITIECYQTIWYYIPTKWNPCWAVIRGRQMTLQQWHWSILPFIYYKILLFLDLLNYKNTKKIYKTIRLVKQSKVFYGLL
tara:strand:+ start:1577 stop:2212 length:636 start_codon:yes stop_codon:yes gene_type:complete